LHRFGDRRAAQRGEVRADHGRRPARVAPARHPDDRRGAELLPALSADPKEYPNMRDMVEIGMGREARRTYELSDVSIVPSRRTRSSKDVDASWRIDAYQFDFPMMMHPTDAISGPESAREFSRLGGLAVLNAEGIWARHEDGDAAIARVVDAARTAATPAAANKVP